MQITGDDFKRHFPTLAAHMDNADIEVLLAALAPVSVKAGEQIITFGVASRSLYLVWHGRLSIAIEAQGKRLQLGQCGSGRWVGEIRLIEPGPASATVTAVEDGTLLALPHETFDRLRRAQPKAASALLQALSLDLAERLRSSGTHLLQPAGAGEYRMAETAEVRRGWFAELGRRLMGLSGEAT